MCAFVILGLGNMLLEPHVSVAYCDKISSNTQFEEGRKGYFGFLA